MVFFYEDIFAFLLSALIFLGLLGYALLKKKNDVWLLLAAVFLMASAGLSDMIFRWNPNPNLVVLGDGMNVFCYCFILAIILNFSAVYFFKNTLPAVPKKIYIYLYLIPLLLSLIYIFTPFMVAGIVHNPMGFKLNYAAGYWVIILYGLVMTAASFLFILWTLLEDREAEERNQILFVLFALILVSYFYSSVILLPFLNNLVNFSSPLPMTFAILTVVYCYFFHGYFAIAIP